MTRKAILQVFGVRSLGASCASEERQDSVRTNAPPPDPTAGEPEATAEPSPEPTGASSEAGISSEPLPLPPPPEVPFIAFPDCVHPGAKTECENGWCRIPAGCFVYGSPEDEFGRAKFDERQSRVTLSRDFEIQQMEVTQRDWLETEWPTPTAPESVSTSHCDELDCPLHPSTWFWGLRYANWLSEQAGLEPCFELSDCQDAVEGYKDFACKTITLRAPTIYDCEGYRLPTSAEWEYAARAGTITQFHSGPMKLDFRDNHDCNLDPNLARVAWYCATTPNGGTPAQMEQLVGLLEPNAWGLHDVLGNASEWVMDEFLELGWGDRYDDPEGELKVPGNGTVRGCAFFTPARTCRVALKLPIPRDVRQAGFRLTRTLGPGKPPTLADVPEVSRTR